MWFWSVQITSAIDPKFMHAFKNIIYWRVIYAPFSQTGPPRYLWIPSKVWSLLSFDQRSFRGRTLRMTAIFRPFLPLPLSKRIMLLLLILTGFGRPPLPPGCVHAKEYPLIALNFVNFILCPYYLRELWFRMHTGVRHFWPPFPPLNHNLTSLHILLFTHPPLLPRLRTY